MPVGIAPTAMQRMAHPQGECATAAAAQKAGALFILSTISTSSIEEVAAAGIPTSAANFFPLDSSRSAHKVVVVEKDLG